MNLFKKTLPLIFAFYASQLMAQSILSQYAENTNFPIQERITEEKILRISNTRRVFILSYENRGFLLGDYVTLILNDQHVARAVTARLTRDGRAGLKIIKIYSLEDWNKLRKGMDIKILRGDDSYYINKKEVAESADSISQAEIAKITSEDDLFNDTTYLEEDLATDDRKKRKIKTDNIVSGNIGFIETSNLDGEPTADSNFGFSWGYQIYANVWAEFSYGFSALNGFPDPNLSTSLQTFIFRGKYTFNAPFYSYVMPYIAYQVTVAEAPEPENTDEVPAETQIQLVDDLNRSGPAVGVTILKRLVPGWFARVDIGTDIVSFGAALEF